MQRRLVLLGAGAQAAAWMAGTTIPGYARAQIHAQILADALGSVVKIEADGIGATGFLWPDAQHVVTALHVVDNSSHIVVHFVDPQARIVDSQVATVERVLQGADLVLLRLPSMRQQLRALAIAPQAPAVDQVMSALGFPLNIHGHSSTDVKIRFGGKTLRTILPDKVLALITDYPDPRLDVLNLEGNLVPGLSGAPLLDAQGRVCGIADGGLEEGAIGICWGIPSAQLNALRASNVQKTPKAARLGQLFGADLQASVGPVIGTRSGGLTKLRTRSFDQLSGTVDDGLGLAQLTNFFATFNPAGFSYDIYQNERTGASVALPAGVQVNAGQDFIVARPPQPALSIRMRVSLVASAVEMQAAAVTFERDVAGMDVPGTVVQQDLQWSNLAPIQRGPLVVMRKAAVVGRTVAGGFPQTQSYLFEALATKGRGFFGVAAVNEDVSPITLAFEQSCRMGLADARCAQVFDRRRMWAQMVLGVQFSSFPV